MITVFGHKNPDTDTICSALIAAWWLRETGTESQAVRLGELNKETAYVLEVAGITKPELLTEVAEGQEVFIVDTNNPGELPETIGNGVLRGIVDHHLLAGGLKTGVPIPVLIEPVACTATILIERAQSKGAVIPREYALMAQAAIISDTLNGTSPTTTPRDMALLEQLPAFSGMATDELADAMFAAKSDLSGLSIAEIVRADSKEYTLNGHRVLVCAHETTKPVNALRIREDIVAELATQKETADLTGAYFFIVDILKQEAHLLVPSEHESAIAMRAFDVMPDAAGDFVLPGIVSRKKQIMPPLEAAYATVS
jgi:manganese-dependent inorganic pyrophosphatase